MTGFIRGLIFWPVLAVFVFLAVANRHAVQVSLDPFNKDAPVIAYDMPLFVVLLLGVFAGIVLGGLSAWADQSRWRRAARSYQRQLQALQASQLAPTPDQAASKPKPLPSKAIVPY